MARPRPGLWSLPWASMVSRAEGNDRGLRGPSFLAPSGPGPREQPRRAGGLPEDGAEPCLWMGLPAWVGRPWAGLCTSAGLGVLTYAGSLLRWAVSGDLHL